MTTTTLQSAGYIVCDDEVIWGYGETGKAAWNNMLSEMKMAGVEVVAEKSKDDFRAARQTLIDDFQTGPATAALLRQVEEEGGNIAWGEVDGIYCTSDEQDEAA